MPDQSPNNIDDFSLMDHDRPYVEYHFRRKNLQWTEEYFLNVLESSSRFSDLYNAVIALRGYGTVKSIPALKRLLFHPKSDIKTTSILTIAKIAGSSETEFFAHALLDPKYREKGYAMWAIRAVADERAVDAVLMYLKKNLSRFRAGHIYSPAFFDGLEYLQKYLGIMENVDLLFEKILKEWPSFGDWASHLALRVPFFQEAERERKNRQNAETE